MDTVIVGLKALEAGSYYMFHVRPKETLALNTVFLEVFANYCTGIGICHNFDSNCFIIMIPEASEVTCVSWN
jgi:hypothetical protein